MSRYIVRVVRREVVTLFADLNVEADTAESARAEVERRLVLEDAIGESLWQEEDAWYTDEPITIKEVLLDRSC